MSGLGNELPGDVPVEPGQEGVQAAPRRASAALAELEARVARQAQMLSVLSALQRGMLVGRSSSDTLHARRSTGVFAITSRSSSAMRAAFARPTPGRITLAVELSNSRQNR